MKGLKNYSALALMMLGVTLVAAACGGGAAGSNGTAGSLTFSGLTTVSTISGLSYFSSTSAVGGGSTAYTDTFINLSNGGEAALSYWKSATTEMMGFQATPSAQTVPPVWYNAGVGPAPLLGIPTCWVSGASSPSLPTCASWGISMSRTAGTISFNNTPVYNSNTAATGTMSGSLTFPPF